MESAEQISSHSLEAQHQVAFAFKQEIAPNFGFVNNTEESDGLIKEYQNYTGSKFSVVMSTKNFGTADWRNKSHFIIFEHKRTRDTIPFDGVPFMIIGHKILQCQHGKDHHKARKEKYNAEKIANPDAKQRRRRIQPTIKLDCPAKIVLREVIAFPEYEIQKDTCRRRRDASKCVREVLASGTQTVFAQHRIYISLPFIEDHKFHAVGTQYPANGILVAITMDTHLVEMMKKLTYLYDHSHKWYRNRHKKEETWITIADLLKLSVDDSKKRWKSIRDKYIREKALVENIEGYTSQWSCYAHLTFLDEHIRIKRKTDDENGETTLTFIEIKNTVPTQNHQPDTNMTVEIEQADAVETSEVQLEDDVGYICYVDSTNECAVETDGTEENNMQNINQASFKKLSPEEVLKYKTEIANSVLTYKDENTL